MANTYSATFVKASSRNLTATANAAFSSSSYTIEAWIKRASTGTTQIIASKDTAGGTSGWALFIDTTNKVQLLHQSIGSIVSITTITDTTTWHHIAGVYNGTTGYVYIDGTLNNSGALNSFLVSTQTEKIGANADGNYFDGKIDEVRYWNVARSATDINNNKSIQIDSATNLVGSWHLDNSLVDSSGNGYTLTNVNSVTFSTDVPFTGATSTNSNFLALM